MVDRWPLVYLRSKDLLLRWMETAAFSDAVYRTHPGNLPSKSWQYNSDNATLAAFGAWASVHKALWPYRKTLVQEAATTGAPVVRHPWLEYPGGGDAQVVVGLVDQFMVGSAVMVAPVLQAGQAGESVRMYLPQGSGSWTHVWSGAKLLAPGWVTLATPMGQPAVVVRTASPWAPALLRDICAAAAPGSCTV